MKLSKAFDGYSIAKLADGYSPKTIQRYSYPLKELIRFLDDPPIDSVTLNQIRRFMHWYSTKFKPSRWGGDDSPLSPSSVDNAWKGIRSFFSWAAEEFGIDRPDIRLDRPKYKTRQIQPFTRGDIRALLKACNRTGGKNPQRRPTAIRDRAIILLLVDTGIRLGELCRLKIGDVSFETTSRVYRVSIRPFGTGRKSSPRTVYLGKRTTKIFWRYLAEFEDVSEDTPLFLTLRGNVISQYSIKNLWKLLGKNSGVRDVHTHRFRHTFAINYLRNGGDVFTLQRLLGHSSLDMVRRYLALSEMDDEEAHRRASPVDRWRL